MDKITIWEYIQQPEKLNAESLEYLEGLTNRYPFFAVAQYLYVYNLKKLRHHSFEETLKKVALYAPSREKLFMLLEPEEQKFERRVPEVADVNTNTVNRTNHLIDSFLTGNGQQVEQPSRPRGRWVDAHTDYIGYLLQTEGDQTETSQEPAVSVPRLNHQELIDDFIGQGDKRIVLSQEETLALPDIPEQESEDSDCLTETLAKIYIKQGRYEKAVEIIRKLSLKNPKKNRYFADQIRFLEKLIINNKNK